MMMIFLSCINVGRFWIGVVRLIISFSPPPTHTYLSQPFHFLSNYANDIIISFKIPLFFISMASLLRRSRPISQFLVSESGFSRFFSRSYVARDSPPLVPHATFINSGLAPGFAFRRFESTEAEKILQLQEADSEEDQEVDDDQVLDFPGGKVRFTPKLEFISGSAENRVPCYRVLDDNGHPLQKSFFQQVKEEVAVKMYSNMVTLQVMDTILYEAQRQGRISFYLTQVGEEAINIASAAALEDQDVVLPQYREPGVLLWRGFTLQEFANQCFGNNADYGKGRQMPIHYGSNKLNYFTVSSPIATQIPQAVGVAYSLKMDKKDACAVTYIGDGGTSEGDFHAGLNFAAVTEAPVVFICRNNGWAISTHISEQFRSDGIVVKGRAYGIQSIRVDGNDALAVYTAVKKAREIAIKEHKPVLVEALTYRVGHHSTSDDSTKYRPIDEIELWKSRSPVSKFRNWVESNGWWNDKAESELSASVRQQLLQAITNAEKSMKPQLADMFSDVYDVAPKNLSVQEKDLRETIKRHQKDYPSDVPF